MANPPFLIIAGKNDQGTEDIAVKIDPSIPLLTAMIRLFRSQGQTRQAVEICRLGLDFFPNQNEIRLLRALCQLDLGETAEALTEIKELASELKPLSPILKDLGHSLKAQGQEPFSGWAVLMAGVLDNFPEDAGREQEAPREEKSKSASDSLVVPTLKKWLEQLQAAGQ
jgi:tetratricopeptide (TPR) repeat protein